MCWRAAFCRPHGKGEAAGCRPGTDGDDDPHAKISLDLSENTVGPDGGGQRARSGQRCFLCPTRHAGHRRFDGHGPELGFPADGDGQGLSLLARVQAGTARDAGRTEMHPAGRATG